MLDFAGVYTGMSTHSIIDDTLSKTPKFKNFRHLFSDFEFRDIVSFDANNISTVH